MEGIVIFKLGGCVGMVIGGTSNKPRSQSASEGGKRPVALPKAASQGSCQQPAVSMKRFAAAS
jgi:hypothetical protein